MKTLMLSFLCCFISFYVTSQTENAPKNPDASINNIADEEIFTVVETMPEYNGGNELLYKDLSKIIIYPQDALEKNETGTVYVTFVIEKDGSISNSRILRGKSESLNKEALRAVSKLPKWKPGMQNGKLVRVQYNLPIKFSLK